jgi:hypothetical protein
MISSVLFSFRYCMVTLCEGVHASSCVSRQMFVGEKNIRRNAVKKIGLIHLMLIAFFSVNLKLFVTNKGNVKSVYANIHID